MIPLFFEQYSLIPGEIKLLKYWIVRLKKGKMYLLLSLHKQECSYPCEDKKACADQNGSSRIP